MKIIKIPRESYEGSGEAILFLRKDNQLICDKILYFKNINGAEFDEDGNIVTLPDDFEIESDEHHHPMKAMLSCWEADTSIGLFKLEESNG